MQANIRQEIIERTDGIPLFVEEVTKAVLETESPRATERTAAAVPSPGAGGPGHLARLADGAAGRAQAVNVRYAKEPRHAWQPRLKYWDSSSPKGAQKIRTRFTLPDQVAPPMDRAVLPPDVP